MAPRPGHPERVEDSSSNRCTASGDWRLESGGIVPHEEEP
jgi:hypothetical protein